MKILKNPSLQISDSRTGFKIQIGRFFKIKI